MESLFIVFAILVYLLVPLAIVALIALLVGRRVVRDEELGQATGDALEQYFATHPPSTRRAREVERMIRRNDRVWQGRDWYVGRTNYRDRVPRSREAREREWARASER